jgi:hypothetical protein
MPALEALHELTLKEKERDQQRRRGHQVAAVITDQSTPWSTDENTCSRPSAAAR